MASAPMRVSQATHGMRWISPPRRPRLRSPVECRTAPCPEKQQTLHERVIEAVIEERDQASAPRAGMPTPKNTMRKPEAGEDDAKVLDRRVREQSLHVGLGRCEHHPV